MTQDEEDGRLLDGLLETARTSVEKVLSRNEQRVFTQMRASLDRKSLSDSQRAWIRDAVARLGERNVFSNMDESKKQEHLTRAARVVVNSGVKVLKPPGRKT